MELGRQHVSTNAPRSQSSEETQVKRTTEAEAEDLRKQVAELKKQIQLSNDQDLSFQKVLPASMAMKKPDKSLGQVTEASGGLFVKFSEDAVALTLTEADKLRASLRPIVAAGRAKIEVVVPPGFSEAKRLGFYRAMAVRNLMVELKMSPDRIDVSVREGKSRDDASLVRILPR